MIPYFYQLDVPILTREEKDELVQLALSHRAEFKSYVSVSGVADGNEVWRDTELYEKPYVKKLIDSCILTCVPVIILHKPGVKVFKHCDEPNKRDTVLSMPLTPTDNYPPTYFFKNREDSKPVAVARFLNLNACLLNTQEVHGLINQSENFRINLQLMFKEPFSTVYQLLLEKKLFRDL